MKNTRHLAVHYLKSLYWRLNRSPMHKLILRLNKELSRQPRYTPSRVSFLGYTMEIVDSASFLSQFREIFLDGIYRFEATEPAPVIYDVGANIGMGTLYLKQLFPTARIVALEADPRIAAVLDGNVRRNELGNVTVMAKAAWINDQGVSFAIEGADGGSIVAAGESVTVPSIRLAALLEQESCEIDLLKMDIEGAESQVVPDLAGVLHKVRNIFVEYHAWNNQGQTLDALLATLADAGFRYYIQTIGNRRTPFIETAQDRPMDMQLNIFGYRV